MVYMCKFHLLNIFALSDDRARRAGEQYKADYAMPAESSKLVMHPMQLKQAWDTSRVSTQDDWKEWIHRLGVELTKESPSHALRACMSLVNIHPPFAKEVFNAAFLSCWLELTNPDQVSSLLLGYQAITPLTSYTYLRKVSFMLSKRQWILRRYRLISLIGSLT